MSSLSRMTRGAFRVGVWLCMPLVAQASAQHLPVPHDSAPAAQHADVPNGKTDVVVVGVPEGPYPVTTDSPSSYSSEAATARQAASDARFFSRCVSPKENRLLRNLIDGRPNRGIRAQALNQIVQDNMACYPGFSSVSLWKQNYYGECNPRGDLAPIKDSLSHEILGVVPLRIVCQSFYDRGALVEKVLALYAPDLSFTTAQVFEPVVLARFKAREQRFDATRSKAERVFAEVAGCAVAVHPQIGLGYLKAKAGSEQEAKLRAALIGTVPECVGGAKQVKVDPSQFRVFAADAIYSWAVALRGTDSLIPVDEANLLPRKAAASTPSGLQ